jgi:hypothetical protein
MAQGFNDRIEVGDKPLFRNQDEVSGFDDKHNLVVGVV